MNFRECYNHGPELVIESGPCADRQQWLSLDHALPRRDLQTPEDYKRARAERTRAAIAARKQDRKEV